jgi:hypothetical protein
MSEKFRLEKVGDRFELLRTTYPEFRAEVDLNTPYPGIRKLKFIGPKPKRREISESKREARIFLELLVRMGQ